MDELANLCAQAAIKVTPEILSQLTHLTTHGHADRVKSYLMDCIEKQPQNVQLWKILSIICMLNKSYEEAECAFETALSLAPDDLENTRNYILYLEITDQTERLLDIMKYFISSFYNPEIYTSYLFKVAQFSNNKDYVFSQFRAYEDHLKKGHYDEIRPLVVRSYSPQKKIRVGYISADFREHPISLCIKPILMKHNKNKFEIHCINSNSHCDAMTQILSQIPETIWHHVGHKGNTLLADYIRALELDVLIDLAGHTAANRLPVFFMRAAPIQMTWMGSVYTTGLSQMDWRITSKELVPEQDACYYTEKLLYLPSGGGWMPSEAAPNVGRLPKAKNKYITFGSLNNRRKINDNVLLTWATLLKCMPTARLIMVTHGIDQGGFDDKLMSFFKHHRIHKRVQLFNGLSLSKFLMLLNKIDINLDTFPTSGGTTTLHATWMGVPTITMECGTEASRVTASIIAPLDLQDCITDNVDAYIDAAIKLASNTQRLAEIRKGLRQRLAEHLDRGNEAIVRGLEAHILKTIQPANELSSGKKKTSHKQIEPTD